MKMFALLYTGLIVCIVSDDIKNEIYQCLPMHNDLIDENVKPSVISYDQVYKISQYAFYLIDETPSYRYKDVLYSDKFTGNANEIFEIAKNLGYPLFLWKDSMYRIEDKTYVKINGSKKNII